MALVFLGSSPCALCGGTLHSSDEIVSVPAFPTTALLVGFADSAMHRMCFSRWAHRALLIAAFNAYYEAHFRGMRVMLDDGSIEEREPRASFNPGAS